MSMCGEPLLIEARALIMRDLVDVLISEDLFGLVGRRQQEPPSPLAAQPLAPSELWCRIDLTDGWVAWRVRASVALQPYRYSGGEVWAGEHEGADQPRTVSPDELLGMLLADRVRSADGGSTAEFSGGRAVVADLRTAVEHACVTLAQRRRMGSLSPRSGGLLNAERLATTRDRPFHPTARAAVGWTAAERRQYGPMRAESVSLAWVAISRSELRHGSGEFSHGLHVVLLDECDQQRLAGAMDAVGVDLEEYQPLPVHPWQRVHTLPGTFAKELASGAVIPLDGELGSFRPTASIRTLVTEPEGIHHVKLPLSVETLGATRLLRPRYLANGERAQRTMTEIIERHAPLRELVAVCDERNWCGWGTDPYANRPGQLAAQVREYPAGLFDDPQLIVLPMAALAADEWDVLARALDMAAIPGGPVGFFGAVAEALCVAGLAFLGCGALPELHGQNVVLALRDGQVDRLILRDHDTLRIYPEWLQAAGVADPEYDIKPGAPQSLRLPTGEALLGYLQTLGFQINLYGIIDALARHYSLSETLFWVRLRVALVSAMDQVELPTTVADVVARGLLHAADWPSRQVFGPLLRRGTSREGGMPAATGSVPNPLRAEQHAVTPYVRVASSMAGDR
ncbi:MAG: hypothetical protein J2P17_04860 [Mycobacterium sp.]|nr:hypothetical protein [Mycobacterium sp.]